MIEIARHDMSRVFLIMGETLWVVFSYDIVTI